MSERKSRTNKLPPPLKHDPQENDSIKGPIIKKAAQEARDKIHKKYDLLEGDYKLEIAHEIWNKQQKILKEKGIDWKTPIEMNPGVLID